MASALLTQEEIDALREETRLANMEKVRLARAAREETSSVIRDDPLPDFVSHRNDVARTSASLASPVSQSAAPSPQTSSSSAREDDAEEIRVATRSNKTAEPTPPKWYLDLTPKTPRRSRDKADVDALLGTLRHQINAYLTEQNTLRQQNLIREIRQRIHKGFFCVVDAQLLRQHRMLHADSGLSKITHPSPSPIEQWPWDLRADARELYHKWAAEIFATDLYRGLIPGKPKNTSDEGTRLDPAYPRVSAAYHGHGELVNGQWWPIQMATLRDGAHGAAQGGISGDKGRGAYSCIMSGGHDYPDEDRGEEVLYCGTDSTDGNITQNTQRMLESIGGQPVRLIRSHKCASRFAPKLGFRYDGLYRVEGFEKLDRPVGAQRHRFRLVRVPGQDPIRGGGEAARPTDEEVQAFKEDKMRRGFAA